MNSLKNFFADRIPEMMVLALLAVGVSFAVVGSMAGADVPEPITYEKPESGGLRAYWTHDGAEIVYEHKIDGTDELSVPVGDVTKGDIRPNVVYVLRKNGSMTKNGEPFPDTNFQTYDARGKFFYVMGRAKMAHPESFRAEDIHIE